jgi:hypothetical protein
MNSQHINEHINFFSCKNDNARINIELSNRDMVGFPEMGGAIFFSISN